MERISVPTWLSRTPQARLWVALAAIHAARHSHIRAIQLDDVDVGNRRITIAGRQRPLDDLTHQLVLEYLEHRRANWPSTANGHLFVSRESAMRHGPVSHAWVLNLRGLAGTIERLRIDRLLEEAIASAGDPLHLAEVFGISDTTAIRYATSAIKLLESAAERQAPRQSPAEFR
jgi:integrase